MSSASGDSDVRLAGMVCQFSGKLVLSRSFCVVAANRGVKTSGPYAVVRHPIYLGCTLTHAGRLLLGPSAWNLAIYGGTLILQIGRTLVEEEVLGRDATYRVYSRSVRDRLLPRMFRSTIGIAVFLRKPGGTGREPSLDHSRPPVRRRRAAPCPD